MSRTVAVALSVSLLLGLLTKLPGLSALDNYAQRAYEGLWYTDIINVHNRDFWAGFVLPYRDTPLEYPVLTGVLHALGGLSGSAQHAFLFQYAVLAACAVVTTAALGRLPGARPLIFALSPALVLYAGMNWDLLALAPLALACVAFVRGRNAFAGGLLGVGIAAKLYPLAFVPALVAARWGAGRHREALTVLGAAVGAATLLNLPVALLAPDGWWYFFEFSATRRAHSSVFNLTPVLAAEANIVGVGIVGLGWLVASWAVLRQPERWRAAGVFMLVWWLLWNKVTSPQFSLFVIFGLAVLDAPLVLALTLGTSDVAYFVTSFHSLAIWGQQRWDDAAAYSRLFVQPVVWARLALLTTFAGWVAAARMATGSARAPRDWGADWRITSSAALASPGELPLIDHSPRRRPRAD